MDKIYFIVVGLLILLFNVGFVQADASEYLTEFNNSGEECKAVDYFVYEYHCPWIFNSEKYCPTVPTFYECCSEESCETIIFDLKNKKFLEEKYNSELVDLNYIKYYLHEGNISEIQFELNDFDVCSPFGSSGIKQETVNLAASTAETISPALDAEKARKVSSTVKAARKVGVVNKFNPATLAASISCSYHNKKLNSAIESLVNVNIYLFNIKNDYAREGYIQGLTDEVEITKNDLKLYVESPVSIGKGAMDWLINVFRELFNLDINKGFDIKETEYQMAQKAYDKILEYNNYLHNPHNQEILQRHNERINEKNNEYVLRYNSFISEYNEVKKIKPSFFNLIYTNVFKKPNYNVSEANNLFNEAKNLKKSSENNIRIGKFNSAIEDLDKAQDYLNQSKTIYLREQNMERKYFLFN